MRLAGLPRFILLPPLAALILSSAEAAQDGDPGATSSSGQTTVSLTIPNLVKISGIDDLALGPFTGQSELRKDDNVCIYSNTSGNYTVTATGNGTDSAFAVKNGSYSIPFAVKWNNTTGTSEGSTPLTKGVASDQTGANSSSQNCNSGSNANFEVIVSRADMLPVPALTYSGTLTFLISPRP